MMIRLSVIDEIENSKCYPTQIQLLFIIFYHCLFQKMMKSSAYSQFKETTLYKWIVMTSLYHLHHIHVV